jgi:hypothetical protein
MNAIKQGSLYGVRSRRMVAKVVSVLRDGRVQVFYPTTGASEAVPAEDLVRLGYRELAVHAAKLRKLERECEEYIQTLTGRTAA